MSDADRERIEDVCDEIVQYKMQDADWLKFFHNSRWLRIDDDVIDEIGADIENITVMQKYKLLRKWKKQNGAEASGAKLREILENFTQQHGISKPQSQVQSQSMQTSQQSEVYEEGASAQNQAAPITRLHAGTTRELQSHDVQQPQQPAADPNQVQPDQAPAQAQQLQQDQAEIADQQVVDVAEEPYMQGTNTHPMPVRVATTDEFFRPLLEPYACFYFSHHDSSFTYSQINPQNKKEFYPTKIVYMPFPAQDTDFLNRLNEYSQDQACLNIGTWHKPAQFVALTIFQRVNPMPSLFNPFSQEQ